MITLLEIWLLGVALAMDCFSVSIAQGLAAKRIVWPLMTAMVLSFGIFQGGMTLLGYLGASVLSHHFLHIDYLAVILLFYLGVKMIWEGCREKGEKSTNTLNTLNITTLSIATSIDALAVGISFACLQDVTSPVVLKASGIIGLCSTLFSIAGLWLGIKTSQHINIKGEILGGIILICIGLKLIFFEDLI